MLPLTLTLPGDALVGSNLQQFEPASHHLVRLHGVWPQCENSAWPTCKILPKSLFSVSLLCGFLGWKAQQELPEPLWQIEPRLPKPSSTKLDTKPPKRSPAMHTYAASPFHPLNPGCAKAVLLLLPLPEHARCASLQCPLFARAASSLTSTRHVATSSFSEAHFTTTCETHAAFICCRCVPLCGPMPVSLVVALAGHGLILRRPMIKENSPTSVTGMSSTLARFA